MTQDEQTLQEVIEIAKRYLEGYIAKDEMADQIILELVRKGKVN